MVKSIILITVVFMMSGCTMLETAIGQAAEVNDKLLKNC